MKVKIYPPKLDELGIREVMSGQPAQDFLRSMLDDIMSQLNSRVPDGFVGGVNVSTGPHGRARAYVRTDSEHAKRAQAKYQLLERALNVGGVD